MTERYATPERKPLRRRAVSLLIAFALVACGSESRPATITSHGPPQSRGGNFDINYQQYEDPLSLNCAVGPFEQHTVFEGTVPQAYIFKMEGPQGDMVQALRVKVFGEGSDVMVATWHGEAREQKFSGPVAGRPAIIPFEPGAEVRIEHVKNKPFTATLHAACV